MAEIGHLDREARKVIALLIQQGRRCRDAILNPPGGSDTARAFNASRAAAQLRRIESEIEQVRRTIAKSLPISFGGAFRDGLAHADATARAAGIRPDGNVIGGDFNLVDSARARVAFRRTVSDLDQAAVSMAKQTGMAMRRVHAAGIKQADIQRLLAGGTISGERDSVRRELRQLLERVANDGLILVNGESGKPTFFTPKNYADMVYRTQLAETYNIATIEGLQRKGLDLVRIVGSNSANFCTAFVDRVFSLSGTHAKYPPISSLPGQRSGRVTPPFHPRCTKRLVAFSEALASPDQLARAELRPNERELLDRSTRDAAKAYRQEKSSQSPPVDSRPVREQLRQLDAGTSATLERLDREINRLTSDAISAETSELRADYTDELSKLAAERQAIKQARNLQARQILKADRPISVDYTISKLTGDRKQTAVTGVEAFVALVDRAVIGSIRTEITTPPSGQSRSFFSPQDGSLHMAKRATVSTVVHELAHALEHVVPALHQASLRFRARRTAGDRLTKLSKLFPGHGYRASEECLPDAFFHPYCGKVYKFNASEIVSMGLEKMYADPIGFAKTDPEYFDFIYRAMRGDYRDLGEAQ